MMVRILELMKGRLVKYQAENRALIPVTGFTVLLLLTSVSSITSENTREDVRIMFYNVENLFDTIDCDLDDDEFLPSALRRWNTYRYYRKLNNISKVIVAAGSWKPPDIIGLCEVENSTVISDLLSGTMLGRVDYRHIYAPSADERGIGVCLVYNSRFELLSKELLYPVYPGGDTLSTRSVLFCVLANRTDTLGVVVTHWPSRRGGVSSTERLRKIVSQHIKEDILDTEKEMKIIIMGDFNCEPGSDLIKNLLIPSRSTENITGCFNPSAASGGSYKYQGMWYQYDQFILKNNLLDSKKGYSYSENSFSVIMHDFMLSSDVTFRGLKPFSTYAGPRYLGGYSDHLPIVIDLVAGD